MELIPTLLFLNFLGISLCPKLTHFKDGVWDSLESTGWVQSTRNVYFIVRFGNGGLNKF